MTINTPAQAFALRDKLGDILENLPGYSGNDAYLQADAEALLSLGVIDVDALHRHGELQPGEVVARGATLTESDLDELEVEAVIERSDGIRYKKMDKTTLPWRNLTTGVWNSSDHLADKNARLVA